MKRTNRVIGWLQRVEDMEKGVKQTLQKGAQELESKCLGSCPRNCRKLGKKVVKMVPIVTGLIERGKFDGVAEELPPPPLDELPLENAVVGFESKFQNKDFAVIGLVGIGGVGKTTLLKQLNDEFLKASHDCDLVIWVVVSKPASLERIRDTIRRKLNIADRLWYSKAEDERVLLIFNKLKNKRFVVLPDDIWEILELSEVVIPQPHRDNGSKVVLTTRSMDAHMSIEPVKDVARECQGLPLALITIGRAMKGKTNAQQWKDAKMAIEGYPFTFLGMEGEVFGRLLFSYDNLPTPTIHKCFKYCSLYSGDHNIVEEEIIKVWLVEGLIDEYDNMRRALLQGRQIIVGDW